MTTFLSTASSTMSFKSFPRKKNGIKELPVPLFRYLTLKSEAEAAKAGNSKAEARANDKAGRYFTRRPAESYLKEFDGGYSSSSDSQIWTDEEVELSDDEEEEESGDSEELSDDDEEEELGDSEELSEQKVTYESSDEEFFDLPKPEKVKFKHLIAGGGKDATLFVAEFRYRPQLMGKSGVLLIGPPGRCRTNLAHAIAYHARFPFHQISGTCASEMDISNVFKKAKWSIPSFVFVDEIDALEPNVATQLVTYMDQATASYIIVIGATDKPYAVHDTLRFDHKVSFSIPDASISKVEILSFHKPSANMANVEEKGGEEHLDELDEDIVESDVELDSTDTVEPDNDPPQQMRDSSVEVTDENQNAAQASKDKALDAISEGKLNEAIQYLTEAILLNPKSEILYATRGSVFNKLKRPHAAIRDADAALKINPDSAKGHKVRGMARAMLGLWKEAASDLHVASMIDFDEEIAAILKKVEPNAQKIEEHCRKYERLRQEKQLRKIQRDRQRSQAESKDIDFVSELSDGNVIGIHTLSELDRKLNAASGTSRLSILYVTATCCGPCRFISPLYTSLAGKYPKVVFLRVYIDETRDVLSRWDITSIPTFVFIENGKELGRVTGANKKSLEKMIAQYAG